MRFLCTVKQRIFKDKLGNVLRLFIKTKAGYYD